MNSFSKFFFLFFFLPQNFNLSTPYIFGFFGYSFCLFACLCLCLCLSTISRENLYERRQPKWDSNKSNGEEFSIANYCYPHTHTHTFIYLYSIPNECEWENGNKGIRKKKKKTTAICVENLNFRSIHSTYLIGCAHPPSTKLCHPSVHSNCSDYLVKRMRWRERKTRKFSSCLISIRVRTIRNLHIKCCCCCCCCRRLRRRIFSLSSSVVYLIFMFRFSLHLISQISHFCVLCVCCKKKKFANFTRYTRFSFDLCVSLEVENLK